MAVEILTVDNTEFVAIPLSLYAKLVRSSERLRVVENYVRRTEYASKKDLLIMLGAEEKAGEE